MKSRVDGKLRFRELNKSWKRCLVIEGIFCFGIFITADAQRLPQWDFTTLASSWIVANAAQAQGGRLVVPAAGLVGSQLSVTTPDRAAGSMSQRRHSAVRILRWQHSRRAAKVRASTFNRSALAEFRLLIVLVRVPAGCTFSPSPRAPPYSV